MKFISWNVNGIRACIGKGFEESFRLLDADIFCLQETKCQQGQVELELPGYHQYWNYANRRGYSGTAVFTKKEPISVSSSRVRVMVLWLSVEELLPQSSPQEAQSLGVQPFFSSSFI